ncbi:recombinase family protein [Sediminicoccus sp. KRV36]|nr:recombinase family protein [Sediminicoccus rosea]
MHGWNALANKSGDQAALGCGHSTGGFNIRRGFAFCPHGLFFKQAAEGLVRCGRSGASRRIFSEYASGLSPVAIARRLNEDHIPGPMCQGCSQYTIRRRSGHGAGFPRNRLYIGEAVWNRRHRVVDPFSGRSSMRGNAAEKLVVVPVPELRCIDDALWRKVQTRLLAGATPVDPAAPQGRFWEKRRPKHLLSGTVFCGSCGGSCSALRGRACACTKADLRLCTNPTPPIGQSSSRPSSTPWGGK